LLVFGFFRERVFSGRHGERRGLKPTLRRGGGAGGEVVRCSDFAGAGDFTGGEENFIGDGGVIDFDADLLADGEEEIEGVDGLIGIGGDFIVEAGVDFADEFGAAGVVFDGVSEGFAHRGAAGVGEEGGGAGQLHGEVGQFGAHAQMARGAFGGFGRLDGGDGVQGMGL